MKASRLLVPCISCCYIPLLIFASHSNRYYSRPNNNKNAIKGGKCSSPISSNLPSRWQFPRGGSEKAKDNEIGNISVATLSTDTQDVDVDVDVEQRKLQSDKALRSTESTIGIIQEPSEEKRATKAWPFSDRLFQKRFSTGSEEQAVLGRAVLTTPHRRMPAIRIAPGPRPSFLTPQTTGPIFSSTPMYVTKSAICKSLNCALRDLRIIDQCSGNRYAGPAFLARRNCVIVNVGHVRAIVMRDQVIIFMPWDQSDDGGNSNSLSNNNMDGENMVHTIKNLVEALVKHLNTIYHSNHNFAEDTQISSSLGTDNLGESLESIWYQEKGRTLATTAAATKISSGADSGSKEINTIKGKRKRFKREKKQSSEQEDQQNMKKIELLSKSKAPPFELVVIEALLGHVCSNESNKASQLIQRAKDVLSGIMYNTDNSANKKKDAFLETQRKLGELLPLKNKVDELEAECREVASAIEDVLKNDEDMAAMRLSEIAALRDIDRNSASVNELLFEDGDPYNLHVEVELLFEDYLLQMDEVLHSLRSIQSSITNTEEVVEIELDLLRNRIMRYEMLLELSGLVVGIAAAVTGAFGMNLVNHFEEQTWMFYKVSAALLIFMAAMGYAVLKKLAMDNIL